MQEDQIIEFYKERSFSDKISATVEFLRQNLKSLSKIVLILFGPLSLILGLLFSLFMMNMPKIASQGFPSGTAGMSMMSTFLGYYLAFVVVAMVLYALFTSMVCNYIKIYNKRQTNEIEMNEVWKVSWKDVPKIIGYFFVAGFLIMLGMFAFFIGAIYLAIVLSLGISIMIFEDKGVFEAISRCFALIKEKWFSTLGLIFVIGIMQYAAQFVFSIPYYAFNISSLFIPFQDPDPYMFDSFSTGKMIGFVISVGIMMLGGFFSYLLPTIAISYQYSNLVERQESRGLMNKIDSLDDKKDKDDSYL